MRIVISKYENYLSFSKLSISSRCFFYYLGAGQIFRAIGHLTLENIDPHEAARYFTDGGATYAWDGNDSIVEIEGKDVTLELDDDRVATQASRLAKNPGNLDVVNHLIRSMGLGALRGQGIICEGRNTATAIFPERDVPFYVTADVAVRARRRYETYLRSGKRVDFNSVLQDLVERDQRDKTRSSHPLGPIPESVIIDTTTTTVDEAEHVMQQYIDSGGSYEIIQ